MNNNEPEVPLRAIPFVMAAVCAQAASGDGIYRDAGASAFQFLKIEVSARAAALGGTVLFNSGPLSGFSCPSGLAHLDGASISASHASYFGSASQNTASITASSGGLRFSAGLNALSAGGLEYRGDEPAAEPLGTFDYLDLALSGAVASSSGPFDAGLGAKLLHEEIWETDEWGFSFDASAAVHPLPWLDAGIAAQNIGPSADFGSRPGYRMPMTWRAGVSTRAGLPWAGPAALTFEACKPIDNEMTGGAGLELSPAAWLDLRGGYRFGSDSQDFTAGIGLAAGGWSLDYAWIPGAMSLGDVHRIVLTTGI